MSATFTDGSEDGRGRDLLVAKLNELVDAAPPQSEDQRRRLAAIIRGGAA